MEFLDFFETDVEIKILGTGVLVVVLYLLRLLAYRLITRHVEKINRRYAWRQSVNYVIYALALLLVVRLWFAWFQSVWTLLSLVAAALVIISKELLLNLVASGVILWRQLFEIGDRVQVGDRCGDVIDTGPIYFSLAEVGAEEPTGRIIKVPNSMVLTQPVTNYTGRAALLWHEITLDLKADSSWEQARRIATEVAEAHTYVFTPEELADLRNTREEIIFTKTTPSVYVRVREGKMAVTIRYLCKFHKRRTTEQQIWEDLLARFAAVPDVHLFTTP